MEENKKLEIDASYNGTETEERSSIDFTTIYTTLILNWKWYLLSMLLCIGLAAVYLRYADRKSVV